MFCVSCLRASWTSHTDIYTSTTIYYVVNMFDQNYLKVRDWAKITWYDLFVGKGCERDGGNFAIYSVSCIVQVGELFWNRRQVNYAIMHNWVSWIRRETSASNWFICLQVEVWFLRIVHKPVSFFSWVGLLLFVWKASFNSCMLLSVEKEPPVQLQLTSKPDSMLKHIFGCIKKQNL